MRSGAFSIPTPAGGAAGVPGNSGAESPRADEALEHLRKNSEFVGRVRTEEGIVVELYFTPSRALPMLATIVEFWPNGEIQFWTKQNPTPEQVAELVAFFQRGEVVG